ncbi:hypothetical protein C8R46DRAFT_1362282 [Mycena filopes]|nr:hypothetical protein C8R46DRAFT_1362282 [Mycena filopes]
MFFPMPLNPVQTSASADACLSLPSLLWEFSFSGVLFTRSCSSSSLGRLSKRLPARLRCASLSSLLPKPIIYLLEYTVSSAPCFTAPVLLAARVAQLHSTRGYPIQVWAHIFLPRTATSFSQLARALHAETHRKLYGVLLACFTALAFSLARARSVDCRCACPPGRDDASFPPLLPKPIIYSDGVLLACFTALASFLGDRVTHRHSAFAFI